LEKISPEKPEAKPTVEEDLNFDKLYEQTFKKKVGTIVPEN